MKSISITNPAITENKECTIVKVHAPVINIKVGVSPYRSISVCLVSLPALQTFGYHSKQIITYIEHRLNFITSAIINSHNWIQVNILYKETDSKRLHQRNLIIFLWSEVWKWYMLYLYHKLECFAWYIRTSPRATGLRALSYISGKARVFVV